MNRSLLTAFILSNAGDMILSAELLGVDSDLLESAVSDYESLSNRNAANIESKLIYYVNVEKDGTYEQTEILDKADEIADAGLEIDRTLENYYHTLIINRIIETEKDFDIVWHLFRDLHGGNQQYVLFNALQTAVCTMSDLSAMLDADGGNIFRDDSMFWGFFRDIVDSDNL